MLKRTILLVLLVLALLTGCSQVQENPLPTETALLLEPSNPTIAPTDTASPQGESPTATVEVQAGETSSTEAEMGDPSSEAVAFIPCSGVLTSANQEGPYYLEGSPEKSDLVEAGLAGTPVVITGSVYDQECNPIPEAKVDFWQANAEGVYDNAGYVLRGHVVTDANGVYSIRTIEPGLYTGRPPHIHVKVFAPDGRELLTTQLYFPGSENSADVRAAPDLLVTYLEPDDSGERRVVFNFIVQAQ
jgi:protocatechuate 3,4-dioxygenase beta subunit